MTVMYYAFAFLLGVVIGALVNKKRTVNAVEEAINNLLDIEPGDDDDDPDEEEIWDEEEMD
jgi:hypothetical protein